VAAALAVALIGFAAADDNLLRIERSEDLRDWSALPLDPATLKDGWVRVPQDKTGEFYRVKILKASAVAQGKLTAYAASDGRDPSLALTVEDFLDLGIVGVTHVNLADVNTQIIARGPTGSDTLQKLQWLVDDVREGIFDIYVSSLTGDDNNNGKSSSTAFATLAKAQQASLAIGNGVTIRLADGSFWRESLDLSALSGVMISSGIATIDGADVVDSLSPHPILANVWMTNWRINSFETIPELFQIVCSQGTDTESATLLRDVTTASLGNNESQVATTPGSYFFDKASEILYIHPRGSLDPTTSGQTFIATKRLYVLRTGAHGTVEGVITRNNGHNDGSLILGKESGIVRRTIARSGHKHNALVAAAGSPVVEDTIVLEAREADAAGGGAMIVFYARDPNACDIIIRRLMAIGSLDSTHLVNTTATYAHGGGYADLVRSINVEGLAVDRIGYTFSGATRRMTITGGHLDHFGVLPNIGTGTAPAEYLVDLRYLTGRHTIPLSNKTSGNTYQLRDSAFYWDADGSFMQMIGTGSTALIMDHVSLLSNSGSKLSLGTATMSSITQTYCVLTGANQAQTYLAVKPTGIPYIGDHNVFWRGWRNTSSAFIGLYHGSGVTTLSDWQARTGQDANSVTLATVDQVAGGASAFWLGWSLAPSGTDLTTVGPAIGDFRINPNARVYSAAGVSYVGVFPDGVPITAAGPQGHWDFNLHAVVSGPPQAWPVIPTTVSECESYIAAPEAWRW
jgi:hypothetical protein